MEDMDRKTSKIKENEENLQKLVKLKDEWKVENEDERRDRKGMKKDGRDGERNYKRG